MELFVFFHELCLQYELSVPHFKCASQNSRNANIAHPDIPYDMTENIKLCMAKYCFEREDLQNNV